MTSKLFNIGIVIVSVSFIASILSFYLLYFTIPMFIIGVILIIFSQKSKLHKIIAILLPILLYLPCTALFLWIYNYSKPKVFLIPKGYNGVLRVVYEEPCGSEILKQDGKEIYVFPENGLLILRNEFDGIINHTFYYVDKEGKRTLINQSSFAEDNSFTKYKYPLVSSGSSGAIYLDDIKYSKEVKYSDFFIEVMNDDDNDYLKRQIFMDSLVQTIIPLCRD